MDGRAILTAVKVMVTGGTGMAGSHTVRALAAAGHGVRLLVRERGKVRRVFDPHGVAIPEADIVEGDMADESAVAEALRGCDAVFHAAALVDMRRAMARRVLETNARGVELVLGSAVRRGLPSIVYVSSLTVFFRPGAAPLTLDMPIAWGQTAYARSKAAAERAVRRMQEAGAPIRVTYPSAICGPDDPGPGVVTRAVCSWLDICVLTPGGFQVVDARDLAVLHRILLEQPSGAGRYAAAGEMLRWPEIYALMEQLTGRTLRHIRIPGALFRALGSLGDVAKRIRDFNYPLTRDAMEFVTRWPGADASRTLAELAPLGLRFRPAAETYTDTLRWLAEAGHLPPAKIGRLADANSAR